jgi:hypothetical protein
MPNLNLEKRDLNIEHLLPQNDRETLDYTDSEKEIFDTIGNLLVISRHTNSSF